MIELSTNKNNNNWAQIIILEWFLTLKTGVMILIINVILTYSHRRQLFYIVIIFHNITVLIK